MKTNKEYPATHSMATSWFAVDAEGSVGIIEFEDNGPVPTEIVPEMECTDSIISEAICADYQERISFEPAQILTLMRNSISAKEYLKNKVHQPIITDSLIEIDSDRLPELLKAASHCANNKLVPLLPEKGIYYIDFWYNYIDKRFIKTDEKLSEQIYDSLFENNVIKRIIQISFDFDFCDNDNAGVVQPRDIPFAQMLQDYSNGEIEMIRLPLCTDVKFDQLGPELKQKVIRLPFNFNDISKFRIEDYYPDSKEY